VSKEILVLYHANCPDGFGAAWSFWRKYGDKAEYIPVTHGESPPPVNDRSVYIVDFSYDRVTMEKMAEEAESLVVLDHHISAQEACGDLDFCIFDMSHSGAYLAWSYLFPDDNVPLLIMYIEDRDLWKWELDSAEAILSVVDSFPKTFESWDHLNDCLDAKGSVRFNSVKDMGEGILAYKETLIKSLLKNSYRTNILGFDIPIVNAPFFQSEMAAQLAIDEPFAAAYYFNGESYKFSLRSTDKAEDVSKIATRFGGGGHRNASGFLLTDLSVLPEGKLTGENPNEENAKVEKDKSKKT
tara:strand:+ start:1535 stop:2428 length:894 start_codon:yes stop_codon:yes gene_type:complete